MDGKFGKSIAQPFRVEPRLTEFPGSVQNANIQKNGPGNDVFKDVNAEVNKPTLKTGMVDFEKQFNHRENQSKTNQIPGRNNWKGVGTVSDPWDYDHESVWNGQKRLSTFNNRQSFVRPFAK